MGKLLFFSDLHLEGDGLRETGLEEIVEFANQEKVDELIFGGDAIGHSPAMVAEAIGKTGDETENTEASAKVYELISNHFYSTMDGILSEYKGELHGIQGNHDPTGIFEKMKSVNFEPTDKIGKVYIENAPLKNWKSGWDSITIPENRGYWQHSMENKQDIMLWHQGPYDVEYGNGNKFVCPDELKELGKNAKINLHGHNHKSFVKYDAETKSLNVNMITQDGYFAIVNYDKERNPTSVDVYRNMLMAENKPNIKQAAQEMYASLTRQSQEQDKAA